MAKTSAHHAAPRVGDCIEVHKHHGGGFGATVTSVGRMIGVVDGRSVEHVFASLDVGGAKLSAELQRDADGCWYARERDLQEMVTSTFRGGPV